MRRLYVRFIWWLCEVDQTLSIEWLPFWLQRLLMPRLLYTLAQNEEWRQGCNNCVTRRFRECDWPRGECAGFMSMFEEHLEVPE